MRKRLTNPMLIRSTDSKTNSNIVRKSKRHIKRIEKSRTVEVLVNKIAGRFVYIDPSLR